MSPATQATYFHKGVAGAVRNSEDPTLSKAILKFFGEHIGHHLEVWPEEKLDSQIDDEFVEIGGDSNRDASLEAYVEGFEG